MKKALLMVMLLLIPAISQAEEVKVKWLALDRALQEAGEEKKPVLIDFYADWCGYCKKMKRETYGNRLVIERINKMFKAVSVNIEGRKEFVINGKKVSESRFADGFNVTSTPTTWFLKTNGDLIKGIPGYMEPEEFLQILNYVGEGWYEKMGIMEYLNKNAK